MGIKEAPRIRKEFTSPQKFGILAAIQVPTPSSPLMLPVQRSEYASELQLRVLPLIHHL
jgi:hypothetical protein